MPTARRSRILAAQTQALWDVIADPHHLPRWWPRVARVEDVEGNAFTEVMKTAKGKVVRADFELVTSDEPRTLRWEQRLEGTAAAVAIAIARGADIVRVHDVGAMVKVARVADAITRRANAAAY